MDIKKGDKIRLKTLHKIRRHVSGHSTDVGWCVFNWTMSHFENLNREFTVTSIIGTDFKRYVVNDRYVYPKEFIVCQ